MCNHIWFHQPHRHILQCDTVEAESSQVQSLLGVRDSRAKPLATSHVERGVPANLLVFELPV